MAPSRITEDYYAILEVDQLASTDVIAKSYRRLAFKLHPDRNSKANATEDFQRPKLGKAYETLKDDSKRQAYNLLYPSIRPGCASSHTAQEPPTSASSPCSGDAEHVQIAAIQKLKQKRAAKWHTEKTSIERSQFEMQREIWRLEKDIAGLTSIAAAEAAVEAQKNSWMTWLLSPLYKKVEDSEEEKERKDRNRQERRIEQDLKERRLHTNQSRLDESKTHLKASEDEMHAANLRDDRTIQSLQAKIWQREHLQRQAKEQAERQKREEEIRKRQEQLEKEQRQWWERQAEELKRRRAAAAAERRYEAELERQRAAAEMRSMEEKLERQWEGTTTCRHDYWWPKVQGRASCPTCYESWTYLLQCPGCKMKACPRCQAAVRPRHSRRAPRTYQNIPEPDFDVDW
ncbi:DnaJ-domain-containing protein [Periconia macrospinosa]|uniref:DnaJ-domain-containing protein n=1 Tax=Periconia macrospinosa TaxID=97972 RepID=A0A2V1DCM7_9PLEO|nr:DnaJ-domain-containing protein [Periconia macrospinosa]